MKIFSFRFCKLFIPLVFLLSSTISTAQVKGLYVDFFGNYILHDATLKTNLINYASTHGFNYLLLYDVQGNVLDYTLCQNCSLTTNQYLLRDFIANAKNTITGLKIGVSGGALKPITHGGGQSQFFDNVKWFNDMLLSNERIDVIHLEDEYWQGPLAALEGQYDKYINQLTNMWSIRNSSSHPLIVETYLGEINNIPTRPESSQVADIDPITDRILLHCYMPNQFMQNRLANPGYVNMQFEYDWGRGKRYEYFAGNQKETKIIPIFSAEACDISASTTNYYGDYLWFEGILANGTACPASTAALLNYPFSPLTYLNNISQPAVDFDNSYNNNTDPYNESGNPGRGYPCGTPDNIASCTDINNLTYGNSIVGEMWFKYGLMPLKDNFKPLYLDCGNDQLVQPNANYTIHPTEYVSNISAAVGGTFQVIKYNWYKNGEHVFTTFPASPDYIVTASNIPYESDIYTCEIVTNQVTPHFLSYRIRDDIKITSDPLVGISFYLSYRYTPATCPDFNNGSITLYPQGCGCTATYSWNNGSNAQTISNLAPGIYTVTATNNYNSAETASAYISIPSFNNFPNPVIFNSNPLIPCDNALMVSPGNASYQWYFNNASISGATSNSYSASQSGSYTVEVTNTSGCTGSSTAYILDMTVNSNISGSGSTCGGTQYTVPDAGPGAIYLWQVPTGATFFQNKNFVEITWGSAYLTGGEIRCTITNDCGTSALGTMQVTPFLLIVASTYSCQGLNNGSIGVTASGGRTPYTYLWNGGSNTSSPFMSNLAQGNYTVTVTNADNCTTSATISVNNFPSGLATPQIYGTSSAAPGNHTFTINNYNSLYDNYYTWNPITNSGTATITYLNNNKQTAVISWPASGGRLVVSLGVAGCLQSVTHYIQPYCQSTYTYLDGSNQTHITSSGSITRNNMTFNGLLTITNDFEFNSCGTVSFAPGAKILVKAGKTLTISNCTFAPSSNCCKMWKGIELEPNARIIIKDNSYIAEAEIGLLVNDRCIYTILNSHFRNNYIGIQIGTGASVDLTGSTIKATEFYSDPFTCGGSTYNPFVTKYDGQATAPGINPLAGIKIDNCTYFKFGSSPNVSGGDVRFNNLSNGIIANNSNIYIRNFSFKNIFPDANYTLLLSGINGCGISSKNGYLSVRGLGGLYNSDNTIENCSTGFLFWGTNGEIKDVNTASNTNIGCYLISTKDVHISRNTWQSSNTGIWTVNNPDASITIDNNDFRMSNITASYACIRNDEYSLYSTIGIKDNTMRLNLARYGIISMGMVNAEIKQNTIQMNNNANKIGIEASDCRECTYKCNTVYALQTYSNPQRGLEINTSNNSSITCNWFNRQQTGVRFNGTCTDTRFEGNTFNDHNVGLGLYYAPQISPQMFAGNFWEGIYSIYGAYLSQIDQSLADANRFTYNSGNPDNFPVVTNDIFGFNWFQGSQDQEDFSCVQFNCQPTIPREEQVQDDDQRIAEPNPSGDPIDETSNYMADRFLFEKLSNNPDFLQNNPILQAFYNQQLNGSVGLFSGLQEEIASVVRWETVYALVFSTNQTMILNKTDSIYYLDSLLELSPGDNSIIYQIEQLNNDVRDLEGNNDLIKQTINQISDYRKANALYSNSNLPTTEAYEYNEAVINEIYLNTLAQGIFTFTSNQESDLINIMEQCPFTGGPAVYKARSLYSLIDNTMDWNDDVICISSGVSPRLRKPENTFVLYPNPTTGIVSINYKLNTDESGSVEIKNMLGVPVSITQINADSYSIDIDLLSLRPAIYQYNIIVNNNRIQQGMITIIR